MLKKIAVPAFFMLVTAIQVPALHGEMPRNIHIQVQIEENAIARQGQYQSVQKSSSLQMLVVLEGYDAKLTVGRRIPQVTRVISFLGEQGYLSEEVSFRDLGTRLNVRPRIVGGDIELSITPEISYESPEGRGIIELKSLTTVVRVPPGRTVKIGEFEGFRMFSDDFFQRETGERVQIHLTPSIMS